MAVKVVIKLKSLLDEHNMSIRELSRQSDVRHAAISELINGKRQNINFSHIEKIAEVFNLKDIRKIIDIVEIEE